MLTHYKNPLRTHQNHADKTAAFVTDRRSGGVAYQDDQNTVPLTDVRFDQVEYIGGRWCVQTNAVYDVYEICGNTFIMGGPINFADKNRFEYYKIAKIPTFSCFGPATGPVFNMIAAKCVTDHGKYWGYGNDIATARAFLCGHLFDEYADLFHAAAFRNIRTKNK